ncbi:MAG: diguanylate cyclase [Syntrophales bacterium]|jgi:diguanylate cyclase (GGDEF)-like protein/PAS domain S-box-containing protein|nr:diguanylate cyclase [Syntrophales bacterium]
MSLREIITKHSKSFIIWLLLCSGLYLTSLYNYLLFHVVAEWFSVVIAFSIFLTAWNTRRLANNHYVLFLSIAFLFAGFIDLVHTLTYRGMGIFPGFDANLPTQLWIIARYLQSLSLLAAPWFIDRKLKINAVFGFYLSLTILLLAAVFSGTLFPACFVEGRGLTPFKIVSEYLICTILLLALIFLLHSREKFDPKILQLMLWSLLFTIVSELAFTFYISVYGLSNLIGHYFKIFAFFLVYRAIIVTGLENPYRLLFYDLQKNREELQVIIDSAPIMIFYKDRENRLIRVNKALADATGLLKEKIEGRNASDIYPSQAARYWEDDQEVIASGKSKTGIIEPIATTIGQRWLQTDKIPYREANGRITGVIGFSVDITERQEAEEALRKSEQKYRELSIVDGLTQLYNSRYFYHQLKIEIDRANRYDQPLTMLLLDIDDFKQFNDAYGHIEGDQVLSRLGQMMKQCLRQTDSAYRYGGEEFTVMMPMTESRDGRLLAERLRQEFKKELFSPAPGQEVHLTVSIGIGQYKTQEKMKGFVNRVDQLMYQGKKNGKDQICADS